MPISKEIIIKNCCICNKPFKLSYNQKITYYKDPNHKFFCSKKCRGKYDSITRTKPMKQINMKCKQCNKDFILSYYQLQEYNKGQRYFYCSRSCAMKSINDKMDFKNRNEKSKQTKLEKYGTETYNNREKAAKTLLETTGYDNNFKNVEKLKRIKEEKYGDPYYTNRPKSAKTLYEHYGKNGNIQLNKISDINKSWAKYLNINEFEFPIKSYSYDLKINKILIEIDPTWTHHSKEVNSFFSGVTYDYHLNKTNLAWKNKYRCIHIFDWDTKEKIKYLLNNNKSYAKDYIIQLLDENQAKEFFEKYDFNPFIPNKIYIGLYSLKDNKLYCALSFGKHIRDKAFENEIFNMYMLGNIVGGYQKIFNYIKNNYNINRLCYYLDISKYYFPDFKKIGFVRRKKIKPIKYWNKNDKHIQTHDPNKEKELYANNYLPIYDCGRWLIYIDI